MVNIKSRFIILFAGKDGEYLHSPQKHDQKLAVALIMNSIDKFRLKLKKVGKTPMPLKNDLNQMP